MPINHDNWSIIWLSSLIANLMTVNYLSPIETFRCQGNLQTAVGRWDACAR